LQYRNNINRLITFAKQNYYQTTIFNSINDAKRLWYNVKNIINLKRKRKIVPHQMLNGDNRTLLEPVEIANELKDQNVG